MAICPHKARQRDLQSQHLPASLFPHDEGWGGGECLKNFLLWAATKTKFLSLFYYKIFKTKRSSSNKEKINRNLGKELKHRAEWIYFPDRRIMYIINMHSKSKMERKHYTRSSFMFHWTKVHENIKQEQKAQIKTSYHQMSIDKLHLTLRGDCCWWHKGHTRRDRRERITAKMQACRRGVCVREAH